MSRSTPILTLAISALLSAAVSGQALADEQGSNAAQSQPAQTAPPAAPQATPQSNKLDVQQGMAWLGIALEPVPELLLAQLPDTFKEARGVVVAGVNPRSPAAEAGLQENDILMQYDGEKLQSPAQLMELVHGDQPEQKVSVTVLRAGKPQTLEVTLGKRASRQLQMMPPVPRNFRPVPMPHFPQWQPQRPRMNGQPQGAPQMPQGKASSWEAFESFKVSTLPGGKVHAEVSFKAPQGESKSYTFEGDRDEVKQQIQAEKGLSDAQKNALLNALNLNPIAVVPPVVIPPAVPMPKSFGFDENLLPKDFFQQPGFDDPLFKRFFQQFESAAGFPEMPMLPRNNMPPAAPVVPLTPEAPEQPQQAPERPAAN